MRGVTTHEHVFAVNGFFFLWRRRSFFASAARVRRMGEGPPSLPNSSLLRSSPFRETQAGWTRALTSRRARNFFSRAKAGSPFRKEIPRPTADPRATISRGFQQPLPDRTSAVWPARSPSSWPSGRTRRPVRRSGTNSSGISISDAKQTVVHAPSRPPLSRGQ